MKKVFLLLCFFCALPVVAQQVIYEQNFNCFLIAKDGLGKDNRELVRVMFVIDSENNKLNIIRTGSKPSANYKVTHYDKTLNGFTGTLLDNGHIGTFIIDKDKVTVKVDNITVIVMDKKWN